MTKYVATWKKSIKKITPAAVMRNEEGKIISQADKGIRMARDYLGCHDWCRKRHAGSARVPFRRYFSNKERLEKSTPAARQGRKATDPAVKGWPGYRKASY